MPYAPVVVSVPIADRRTTSCTRAIAVRSLNHGVRLMLVPTGGFGWVIGDHEVARRGHSECVFSLGTRTEADVDELVNRAHQAGAEVVTKPGQEPRRRFAGHVE